MKLLALQGTENSVMSHPVRGAWVEICHLHLVDFRLRSHPVRGAWVEIWCP